ncbi:MAG: ABC transporter substrate-binding protein [Thermoplasmata archaeon]|nr:ABC transporter substrate-binding protein [Candidatus Sysuiplasma jiujiangense]
MAGGEVSGQKPEQVAGGKKKSNSMIAIVAVVIVIIIIGAVVGYEITKPPAKKTAVPSEIKVGILYASTGSYATSSISEYDGFSLWAKLINANGGIMVPQYGKKLPVKIYSYNDASSTSQATTYYDELITSDHVNVLVADFGSVLTAPAVSVALANKVLLIDITGSSANFFNASNPNPYTVLTSIPFTPSYVYNAPYDLLSMNITKVAVLYAENDFTQPLASALVSVLAAHGVTPVYDQGYATSTSSFSSQLAAIEATHPQALVEYGYPTDDIPFLNGLASSGLHFNYTFTIFPGQLFSDFVSSVGANMSYTYTFSFPPEFAYKNVNYGLNQSAFETQWNSTYPSIPVNYLSLAGYNAGLILQKALETSTNMTTPSLRAAINGFSGKLNTLMGTFTINTTTGAQTGETPPIGQIIPGTGGTFSVRLVYPASLATGTPVYPAPT